MQTKKKQYKTKQTNFDKIWTISASLRKAKQTHLTAAYS